MSNITLNTVASGFNLSSLNANFQSLEATINGEILHLTGGNNVMQQDLDMNSNHIYNILVDTEQGTSAATIDYVDSVVNDVLGGTTSITYNNLSVTEDLTVSGDTSVGGGLTVTGITNLTTLNVSGDATVEGDLDVLGHVTGLSVTTLSYSRGKRVDVASSGGAVTIDWEAGTTYRITIGEDTTITLANMPDNLSDEEQTIYIDLIDAGDYTILLDSTYVVEWPDKEAATFTPGGRDYLVCASHNGSTITVVPILNIGVPA